MATITEIAEDIYRVNVELPGVPVTVSMFVIDDEEPTLVETGHRKPPASHFNTNIAKTFFYT